MNEQELKNIAPILFELKKLDTGFLVPKDYFDSVENEVEDLLFTSEIDKKNAFSTPPNYLTDIENTIINRVQLEDASIPTNYFDSIENNVFNKLNGESKIISIKRNKSKWPASIAIAASLALLFTLQLFTNSKTLDIASLNPTEIENWITNGELNFNAFEISSVYDDVNIDNFDVYNNYNDEDLLDYLEEINIESLITTD